MRQGSRGPPHLVDRVDGEDVHEQMEADVIRREEGRGRVGEDAQRSRRLAASHAPRGAVASALDLARVFDVAQQLQAGIREGEPGAPGRGWATFFGGRGVE